MNEARINLRMNGKENEKKKKKISAEGEGDERSCWTLMYEVGRLAKIYFYKCFIIWNGFVWDAR